MATYKEKYTQNIISSVKQPMYLKRDDVVIFNLNSCFIRANNYTRFMAGLHECISISNIINLNNLASLCYKLGLDYSSKETISFMEKLVDLVKVELPQIKLTQNNIYNCGEIDLQPIEKPITYIKDKHYITINSIIMDALKSLGYVNNQLMDILDYSIDLKYVLPKDVISKLPLKTRKNIKQYELIKQVLGV